MADTPTDKIRLRDGQVEYPALVDSWVQLIGPGKACLKDLGLAWWVLTKSSRRGRRGSGVAGCHVFVGQMGVFV